MERLPHADFLGTLPGEKESGGHENKPVWLSLRRPETKTEKPPALPSAATPEPHASDSHPTRRPGQALPVIGWLTDFFRLGWSALLWNTRKSWHLARGRPDPCPCQTRSDSGRAFMTGCEGLLAFHSPARFRHVCPLLARRTDGAWVCSVDASAIRPFWGRALLILPTCALALYLPLALLAWGGLRGLGYELSLRQAAWPPAWDEFRQVQARFYLDKARQARAAGRTQEALLALGTAYELDPSDYPAGVLLAQLWQIGQPGASDLIFARLLRDHPDKRETTAQAWYRALLARGDHAAIHRLAGERLLHGAPDQSPAWAQAFLFNHRQTLDPAALDLLLRDPALPPRWLPLLALERSLLTADAPARRTALTDAATSALEPFALYHVLGRLLEEGRPELVLTLAQSPSTLLPNREKIRLRLDALATLGRDPERAELLLRLLEAPTHPALFQLLCAHLILHPDPTLLSELAAKLARDPLPDDEENYPNRLAWFATCAAARDPALVQSAAARLTPGSATPSRSLDLARSALLHAGPDFRIETVLPLLQPLPLEVVYALLRRHRPPPPYPA